MIASTLAQLAPIAAAAVAIAAALTPCSWIAEISGTPKATRDVEAGLLPYQQRWFADESPIKVLHKARRIGGTMGESCWAVHSRAFGARPLDYWFSSADESAAKEFIDECRSWARIFNAVTRFVAHEEIIDERQFKIFVVDFDSCKITAMASSPKGFRSKGGDVCLDEFAFHEQPKEMWAAAWPVTTWGGRMSVISSPNTDECMMQSLVDMGRRRIAGESRTGDYNISLHEVSLVQAIDEGLVERINLTRGTQYTRESFVIHIRSGCDDETYDREYGLKASTQKGSYLPYELTRPCVTTLAPMPTDDVAVSLRQISDRAKECTEIYAGVDIGRVHDRFIIWVIGKCGGVWRTIGLLAWTGRTFDAMEQACRAVMDWRGEDYRQVSRMCIDATGMGMMLGEHMSHAYGYRAEAITLTTNVKAEIYPLMRRHAEERTITLPDCTTVLSDLASVKKVVTVAGNVRYAGERVKGGHADYACALALALHAADDESSSEVIIVGTPGGCIS